MAAERLRVLVVSLGRRGGINDYGWVMARALTAECDVAVVTSSYAEHGDRWSALGVAHIEVPTFKGIAGLIGSFLAWGRFRRIRRFAAAFAPDIVYYPGGHAWKPVLDLILPRSARIVLTLHDPELHAGEDSWLHRLLDGSNHLRVHGYVLLNEAQKQGFIERKGLESIDVVVIPLGSLFDAASVRKLALSEIDGIGAFAEHSSRYLLFFGRIERYKGVELLLRSYAALPASEAPPLLIAGAGTLSAEELRAFDSLGDRPVMLLNRWLAEEEVVALVANARFTVLPYAYATQSGVVPLACEFGVPSIASDAGGLGEQVTPGVTGFLFRAGDTDALTSSLRQASALDDVGYARLADGCRRRVREDWSWDSAACRLATFLRSIATEDSSSR